MNVFIIEDEIRTARDLSSTLLELNPNIKIVAVAESVEMGIELLSHSPAIDLIFSDIQLGDGLSFEIFQTVNNTTPIVFCTAYNEYALNAFDTMGIDYILKPFSKESIQKALNKYDSLKTVESHHHNLNELIHLLQPSKTKNNSVIIYQGDKIIPIPVTQIALFFTEDTITYAVTFDQKKHTLSQTLENLEKQYSPLFFRANRQYLLNRKVVKDAAHHFNRKVVVNLIIPHKEQIFVSKLKVNEFVSWLSDI